MLRFAHVAVFAGALLVSGCGKKSEKVASSDEPEKKNSWLPDMKMPKMFEGQTPQEKARKQIAAVLAADTDAAFFNEVGDLHALADDLKWDSRRLLAEVLDHAAVVQGEQQQGRYLRLLTALQIPKTTIADTAARRLGTGSPQQDQAYQMLLRAAAPPDPRGAPDFSHFRPVLEVNQAQPPERLVLWMFERDPGAALRELTAVYGTGLSREQVAQAVWADHVVADLLWRQEFGFAPSASSDVATLEQLDRLSQSPAWWMRTYVAVVMTRNPALREPAVLRRLTQDPHPIVQRAARRQ